ncbi:MAG: rhomboid family intramembrane serine protease [Solirubrobacteraceae bacterium]|nr:rhomboid family intramembrane serine protease [Solirubrobacteraceae bacterium]
MSTNGHRDGAGSGERDPRIVGLMIVAGMVAVMWVLEIIDQVGDLDLDKYGIISRDVDGLDGIVFSPFLHAGFGHLTSNTLPFLVLGAVIALAGALRVVQVTLIVGLVGGVGTWLISPGNTITVGASGLVFGYAAYLLARGIFSRHVLEIAVGAVVAVVFGGSLLAGLAPNDNGVSWQGHLCGAIGGVIAAYILNQSRRATSDDARATPA